MSGISNSQDTTSTASEGLQRDFSSRVVRNSAFVMGTQVLMKVFAVIFNIFIVRTLGAADYGQYAVVMAFIAIFAIFSDLGMAPYMLREIARERENVSWLLPNIIVMRLILSALVVVIATLSALLLGKDTEMVIGIFIASCGLFLYALQGPLDSTLMAWERVDYSATCALIGQIVFWIFGGIFLLLQWGFIGLLVASLMNVIVLVLLEGRAVSREIRFKELKIVPERWMSIVRAGLPFGISSLSFSLQHRFDTAFMSFTLSNAMVGWYSVPLQIVQMTMLLARSVSVSLFPSLTRAFSQDLSVAHKLVHRTLKYLLIMSLPIAIGGTVLAERIIIDLYTSEFTASIPLLRIMIWTVPILFVSELMGSIILAVKFEKEGAKINVINAVLSVAASIIIIPVWGIIGAAWSRLSVRTLRIGQYSHLLGPRILIGDTSKDLLRVLVAGIGMGILLLPLRDSHILISIGAGASAYLILLFAVKAIRFEEIKQIRTLLMRGRTIDARQ